MIKRIIPVVNYESYAIINDNYISLIEVNHFRNFISEAFAAVSVEIINKGDLAEDLNLNFARIYVPVMSLEGKQ